MNQLHAYKSDTTRPSCVFNTCVRMVLFPTKLKDMIFASVIMIFLKSEN